MHVHQVSTGQKRVFIFYFIFGHQTCLSLTLSLSFSLSHSQTLLIFSLALSICSISWPIYYESVRLMLLEAHQLVSFSLSWPDTAVSFFTLNVKIPQRSLSLSQLNTLGLLSCPLLVRWVLLKAYQPLYLPFWEKKESLNVFIFGFFLINFLVGEGEGKSKFKSRVINMML